MHAVIMAAMSRIWANVDHTSDCLQSDILEEEAGDMDAQIQILYLKDECGPLEEFCDQIIQRSWLGQIEYGPARDFSLLPTPIWVCRIVMAISKKTRGPRRR